MIGRVLLFVVLVSCPALALAHHGQDFLLVESPQVPHPGNMYFIADSQFALDNAEEQAGFEPALLVGVTPRIAFELHAHTEKLAGESWRYEATAPAIHVLLTNPERHDGLKVGLSAEYEIAREADAADNTELRLSVERGKAHGKWAANLILDRAQGGSSELGAAVGLRHQFNPRFALGAEAQASFRHSEGAQLLATGSWEKEQAWTIKLGLGGQKDEDGRFAPVAHVGLVLRLH